MVFSGSRHISKSKMADQDVRQSGMIAQLLCYVTSPRHVADIKGEIFRRTTYHPSLVGIAFIFSKLRGRGGQKQFFC